MVRRNYAIRVLGESTNEAEGIIGEKPGWKDGYFQIWIKKKI
jgi:hypothetical protein